MGICVRGTALALAALLCLTGVAMAGGAKPAARGITAPAGKSVASQTAEPALPPTATEEPEVLLNTPFPELLVPEGADAVYERFVELCRARGDETADDTARSQIGDEEGSVPYYTPVEGVQLSMLGGGEPMYFLVVTDRQRIDIARERTLYADFIRALDPEVSEEDAAGIAGMLIDEAETIFEGFRDMSVGHGEWLYQYMRTDDPEGDPPMLYAMPLSVRDSRPMPEPQQPVSFEGTEKESAKAYERFRELCAEAGMALLPKHAAEPDFSAPDILLMSCAAFDTGEWSTLYSAEGYFGGYTLCVHKDTPAYEDVDELMALFVRSIAEDLTQEDARALVTQAVEGMAEADNGAGAESVETDAFTLLAIEDEIRRALILMVESVPVEGVPPHPTQREGRDFAGVDMEALDAEAYRAFRVMCEDDGQPLLPDAPETASTMSGQETMKREVLQNLEWHRGYANGEAAYIMLFLIQEDSQTNLSVEEIMMLTRFVCAAFGLDEWDGQEKLLEAMMAFYESEGGFEPVPVEGTRLSGNLVYGETVEGRLLVAAPN